MSRSILNLSLIQIHKYQTATNQFMEVQSFPMQMMINLPPLMLALEISLPPTLTN